MTETTKVPRGFALLSPERRKELAARGAAAAAAKGVRHVFTREELQLGGRVGGEKHAEKMRQMRTVTP